MPIFDYHHWLGKWVTGGGIDRGKQEPELMGKYIFADYVSGKVYALTYDEAAKKTTGVQRLKRKRKAQRCRCLRSAKTRIMKCIWAPQTGKPKRLRIARQAGDECVRGERAESGGRVGIRNISSISGDRTKLEAAIDTGS